jgi:hypothetical protein
MSSPRVNPSDGDDSILPHSNALISSTDAAY